MRMQEALKKHKKFEEKALKTGFLYVLNFGEVYKIGQTWNIKNRLKQIQNANPFVQVMKQIEMIGYIEAEGKLHDRFEKNRIWGEWFKLDQRDLDGIIPFLRRREHKFQIIAIQEFDQKAYTHTEKERINILLGVNRSLDEQNKVLRRIIKEQEIKLRTQNYERRD